MKSGFVSIVGRPNVGKSTIINAIIGEKISIVTDKPQTTRNSIRGIYNSKDVQIVFLDTPGIHKPFKKLGVQMNSMAYSSAHDADVLIIVVDASLPFGKGDDYVISHLGFSGKLIICFNKIDQVKIQDIEILKAKYKEIFPNATFVETVATEKVNTDVLLNTIIDMLDEGPAFYPVDEVTDKDIYFRVSEIIREKSLYLLSDEVPHSIAISVESIKQEGKDIVIYASIIAEKDSQKGIIIGKKGAMIKKIGIMARKELEYVFKKHVFLNLQVKVKADWRDDPTTLDKLGYNYKK